MYNDSEIKYCIVAFLDLQGFSNHLELSYDLRTTIGQEAISRLQTLENVLKFLEKERKKSSLIFSFKRINDSIILTMDLNDILRPDIGNISRDALTEDEWKTYYDFDINSDDDIEEKYSNKRKEYTLPALKFLGIVSRLYYQINIEESRGNFPGVKAVVSTGFRKKFIVTRKNEDQFSANFAFSNAYKAQENLRGAKFYLDNNIIKILDANLHIQNIAKLACYVHDPPIYSPLKATQSKSEWTIGKVFEVLLFRKRYFFHDINPNPLSYLQFIDNLNKEKTIYRLITEEIELEDIEKEIISGREFLMWKIPYDIGKTIVINQKMQSNLV